MGQVRPNLSPCPCPRPCHATGCSGSTITWSWLVMRFTNPTSTPSRQSLWKQGEIIIKPETQLNRSDL